MAYDTYTVQGSFTSGGANTFLTLRGNIDWMWVYNETVLAAGGADTNAQFYWQRGMAAGRGMAYSKLAADDSLAPNQLAAGAGFTLVDSAAGLSAAVATTGVTAAAPPLVTTGDTTGIAVGSVIRIFNQLGARQLDSIDYSVTAFAANVSMTLGYMAQIVATVQAGSYRIVPLLNNSYVPTYRYISAITQAAQAVITLTVAHIYEVGQRITINVPAAYGMAQINGLNASITAVDAVNNTITVDIDSTAFNAFVFPLTAAYQFSPALVVPYGSDANTPLLDVGVRDVDLIRMDLVGGAGSPAGANNDVIYWIAGRSFDTRTTDG